MISDLRSPPTKTGLARQTAATLRHTVTSSAATLHPEHSCSAVRIWIWVSCQAGADFTWLSSAHSLQDGTGRWYYSLHLAALAVSPLDRLADNCNAVSAVLPQQDAQSQRGWVTATAPMLSLHRVHHLVASGWDIFMPRQFRWPSCSGAQPPVPPGQARKRRPPFSAVAFLPERFRTMERCWPVL